MVTKDQLDLPLTQCVPIFADEINKQFHFKTVHDHTFNFHQVSQPFIFYISFDSISSQAIKKILENEITDHAFVEDSKNNFKTNLEKWFQKKISKVYCLRDVVRMVAKLSQDKNEHVVALGISA